MKPQDFLQSTDAEAAQLCSRIAKLHTELDDVRGRVEAANSQASGLTASGRGLEGAMLLRRAKADSLHSEALQQELSEAKQRQSEAQQAQQVRI